MTWGCGHFLLCFGDGYCLSDLHSFLLAMSFAGEVKSKNVQSLLSLIGTASYTEFCPQFHLKMSVIPISLDVSDMMDIPLCSATE